MHNDDPVAAWQSVLEAALARAATTHGQVRDLLGEIPVSDFAPPLPAEADVLDALDHLGLDSGTPLKWVDGTLVSTISSPWVVYYYCLSVAGEVEGRCVVESGSGSGWLLAL